MIPILTALSLYIFLLQRRLCSYLLPVLLIFLCCFHSNFFYLASNLCFFDSKLNKSVFSLIFKKKKKILEKHFFYMSNSYKVSCKKVVDKIYHFH